MSQSRAMKEAYQWTTVEALEWARKMKCWPSRRFRLEGSLAGNSRLVKWNLATEMQRSYGGTVVELIPEKPERTKTRYESASTGMSKCPKCKETKGKACRTPHGGQRMPHDSRLKLHAKRNKKK